VVVLMKHESSVLQEFWKPNETATMLYPPAFSMSCFRITRISDYSYIFFETLTDVLQMLFVTLKMWGGIGYKKEIVGTYWHISIKRKTNRHYIYIYIYIYISIFFSQVLHHSYIPFTIIAPIAWSSKARIQLTRTLCCTFSWPTAIF
jgi:hypothetical protein